MKLLLPKKLEKAYYYYRRKGWRDFIQELFARIYDAYFEWRLGVATRGRVEKESLGYTDKELRSYQGISYRAIFRTLKRIRINFNKSIFLDIGAGKGRAVVVAATFPFKKVIGVEISDELAKEARKNIERMKKRIAGEVELLHLDATEYRIPADVNCIFLFNPFAGEVLRKMIENIKRSHEAEPREIVIIFFNNDHFERMAQNASWLEKLHQEIFYPELSCGVYVTVVE